ncbi:hypothetical protein RB601_004442 [Gaeumannomyces tritici]
MHCLLLIQAATALFGLGANARGVDEIQRPGGVVRRSPFRGPHQFALTTGNGTHPAPNSTATSGPTTGPTGSPPGNGSSNTTTTYWLSRPTTTGPQTDCPVQFVTSTMTVGVTVVVTGALNTTTSSVTTRGPSTPPYFNGTTATTYWPGTGTGTGTGGVTATTTTGPSSTAWTGNITTRGQWATTNSTTSMPTQLTTSTWSAGTGNVTTTAVASTGDGETTSCPPEDHTATATVTTTTQVIDTTGVTPVATAPTTTTQTSTAPPTATVGGGDAPTGTPRARNQYCGVHGLPVGSYFLAQFVENRVGVPVTLEGCYQFCKANFDAVGGCRAYDFYLEPGLDVPRCSLYGSDVASALRAIDNNQPHWWFDAACGSPLDPRWRAGHAGVNDHHVDAFSVWRRLMRRGEGGLALGPN